MKTEEEIKAKLSHYEEMFKDAAGHGFNGRNHYFKEKIDLLKWILGHTPERKEAEELVAQYRNILMDEDTDCGNEVLCTCIGIKFAKIYCDGMIRVAEKLKIVDYWANVKLELDKI